MMLAGTRTDHPGTGRCFLHGGATPVKHGKNSKVVRQTIFERVESMQHDPKLLSLDKQLATMHILFEMQLRRFSAKAEGFDSIMVAIEQAIANGDATALEIPDSLLPNLDMETLDMMVKLAKTIYDMRFNKRFSMPLTQVQQLLLSLMDAFGRIAAKYRIPAEARAEFAREIRNLRAAGMSVAEDPQLAYAGQESTSLIIDGELAS